MKENKKTSSSKKVFISAMSFLLSLTMVLLTATVVLGATLFNDRNLFAKVSKTTYFSELNNEIVTRCRTIAAKSGINYDGIAEIITANRVDADFTVYFNSIKGSDPYAGQKTIDTKDMSEELYNSIVSKDPNITEAEKSNAALIARDVAEEYKNTIVLETFEKFIAFSETFNSFDVYAFLILSALFAYLIYIIFFLNGKKQKHRLFRRFAVVSGTVGSTVLVLSLAMKLSGFFQQITFASSQREYNLFMSFFDEFLNTSVFVGAGWIAVCIVLLVLWYLSVTGRIK